MGVESVLSVQSVVNLFLLFLAEFLESGIAAQRIPDRIEPKKGRRNGRWTVNASYNMAFVTAG